MIIAPITSNLATGQADDVLLNDWAAAGLLKPSVVKAILGTIAPSLIRRRMGMLTADDLASVEKTFATVLGF